MKLPAAPALDEVARLSRVAQLGQRAMTICHDVGNVVAVGAVALAAAARLRVDARETVRHLGRFAFEPLGLIIGASAIVGGVVAMQGLGYVARYNATEVFGWAAGMSSFREVGPLLLGLTLASRVGSKNTAELCTMRLKEQLLALEALGLDVTRVVIAPRVLAIAGSTFLLFPIAGITILLVAFALATVIGDQLFAVSWHAFALYCRPEHILEGLFRLFAFQLAVALSSTTFGLTPVRSARDIGRAVHTSSIASICAVVTLNLDLSFLAELS